MHSSTDLSEHHQLALIKVKELKKIVDFGVSESAHLAMKSVNLSTLVVQQQVFNILQTDQS
jgi:hypothetical protein